MNSMLIAKELHKSYHNGKRNLHVLKGVDLSVEKGDMVFIIGPSGAGKSTLLHLLAGLDRPDSGNVFLAGKDLYRLSDRELSRTRNQRIGFVFQFYHLLGEFSAVENVMLPRLISGKENAKDTRRRATEILYRVGLADRASNRVQELSGGEQQRVAIARALINGPDILFCDEPTGNLDSENSKEIYNLLCTLNEREGLTTIIVTHQKVKPDVKVKYFGIKDGNLENFMV